MKRGTDNGLDQRSDKAKADAARADALTRRANDAEMWRRIYRRMSDFQQLWRGCEIKTCRRAHHCADAGLSCIDRQRQTCPEPTPEQGALAMFELKTELEKRLAAFAAKRAEDNSGAAKPRRRPQVTSSRRSGV